MAGSAVVRPARQRRTFSTTRGVLGDAPAAWGVGGQHGSAPDIDRIAKRAADRLVGQIDAP